VYKESKLRLHRYIPDLQPSERFHLSRSIARRDALKGILTDLRDQEIQTMKALVHDELGKSGRKPHADIDQARHQVRFDLTMVSLSESRLAGIWDAFDRLGQGIYGLCELCGNEISIGRLRALPMVQHCVGCTKDGPIFGA
jgi:DnaK suppressor protein